MTQASLVHPTTADRMRRDLFNEPWMDQINPRLLFRYWERKGCPGTLQTFEYGVEILSSKTPMGVWRVVSHKLCSGS